MSIHQWRAQRGIQKLLDVRGGEYLTFWYVGQIAENAVSPFLSVILDFLLSMLIESDVHP